MIVAGVRTEFIVHVHLFFEALQRLSLDRVARILCASDIWRHKNQQLGVYFGDLAMLEKFAESWDIAESGNAPDDFAFFFSEDAADQKCLAVFEHNSCGCLTAVDDGTAKKRASRDDAGDEEIDGQ